MSLTGALGDLADALREINARAFAAHVAYAKKGYHMRRRVRAVGTREIVSETTSR